MICTHLWAGLQLNRFRFAFCMFLWPPYVIGQAIIFLPWFLLSFYLSFFFSSPKLSHRRLDVCHTSTYGACCTWLAENTGRKKAPKIAIWAPSHNFVRLYLQLRHVLTIGKKLVKQQYVLQMSPQYGELRPTSGWDQFTSLGHPS